MRYSEAKVKNLVRLEAAKLGIHLWRNNVGATYTHDGHLLRYGLMNDSTQLNKVIKSSDLIGIRPLIITPEMIGKTIGQFIAREIKHADWKYTGGEREQAQLKFIELVKSLGGDADFSTGEFF